MSARCLSAGKDYAYNLLLGNRGILALLEGDLIFSVSIREKCFNLILVSNALSSLAFLYTDVCNAMSEHARKLRSVLISCFLQW